MRRWDLTMRLAVAFAVVAWSLVCFAAAMLLNAVRLPH